MSEGGDRRKFLQVLTAVGSAALLGNYLYDKKPFLSDLYERNSVLLTGEIGDVADITSEIPSQLKDKKIPEKNEWFTNFDDIVKDGITIYEGWKTQMPEIPLPYYKKPSNYIDVPSLAYKMSEDISRLGDSIKENPAYWHYDYGLDILDSYDQPYGMVIEGSMGSIRSLTGLIESDPGTGFVNRLKLSMMEKFGSDFDVWSHSRYGTLNAEQNEYIKTFFLQWYSEAKNYLTEERAKLDEPLSTSVLFAYFLHSNQGDILKSAWDTSTWLKITARNDIQDDLKKDPTYDRAKTIFYFFKDQFSPTISGNWVVENVSPDDAELNYVEDPFTSYQYKDFMPPNRAGIYHPWTIFAQSMQMSPFLLKRIISEHLLPEKLNNGDIFTEYGKVRTWADKLVVERVPKINSLIDQYEVAQ
jgi:hypothetical protein